MARRPISTITLPTERAKQLRAIAEAHGISLTELIGRFVNAEIRAGIVPDEIPGYRIEAANGGIAFSLGRVSLQASRAEAIDMANCLDHVADLEQQYDFVTLSSGDLFAVRRVGRGLVTEVGKRHRAPLTRRSATPDIAHDLARLIREATKARAGR